MTVEVVPAELKHVNSIARRMRAIDVAECVACGRTGKQALRDGCIWSQMAWTALVDGHPEAMFGMRMTSAVDGVGVPWFLGTDIVGRHARELLVMSPHYLSLMRDSTLRLRNLVSVDNGPAIRLLRKMGFTVHAGKVKMGGLMFHYFEMVS